MRQRKPKNLEKRYEQYEDLLVWEPIEIKGRWREAFGSDMPESEADEIPLCLEIGCGKGRFISEFAKREPDKLIVGIEGSRAVLIRALEKVRTTDFGNVMFIPRYVEDLTNWFEAGEVDEIYLNFSDPLPKTRTATKRLTHRNKLKQYFEVLAPGGMVTFKTDNAGLFEFTIQEIRAADLAIAELTRDLHGCEYGNNDIRTEYEEKFSRLGEKIKRVRIARKHEI